MIYLAFYLDRIVITWECGIDYVRRVLTLNELWNVNCRKKFLTMNKKFLFRTMEYEKKKQGRSILPRDKKDYDMNWKTLMSFFMGTFFENKEVK